MTFDASARVEAGTASRCGQGLGLGLYIALEIAKAHGGTIDVFSDETGTCFTFKMPTGRSKL
jgi:signal transduction histidine kinase